MNSNTGKDTVEILEALREQLSEREKGYTDFENERLNVEDLGEDATESLLKAMDLVTAYGNEYTKVYGLMEEMITIYGGIVDMFNTELIDGRIVDDVLADFEDSLGKVDSFSEQYLKSEEKMVELSETVTAIYDSLEPESGAELAKAKIMNDLEKKWIGKA